MSLKKSFINLYEHVPSDRDADAIRVRRENIIFANAEFVRAMTGESMSQTEEE